jgi:hypothetical protein
MEDVLYVRCKVSYPSVLHNKYVGSEVCFSLQYVLVLNKAQIFNLSLQLQGAEEYNWCERLFPHIPAAQRISLYIYVRNRYQENEDEISEKDKY